MLSTKPVWRVISGGVCLAALFVLEGDHRPLSAHHTFSTSSGIYRIPFKDGTAVTANNDHHTHPNALNRVDLGGGDGTIIVAAASGIIRGIVDHNGNSGGLGDGLAADGITPQDDNLEHSCHDLKDEEDHSIEDSVVKGFCQQHNNYVWIEHPNGEWTKYTHMRTGSVTREDVGFGWEVGDTILVGQAIGRQSDIGSAGGTHLHFEVALIPPGTSPPFSALGGFIENESWNRVAVVCFSDGDDIVDDDLYTEGEAYTAGPCVNTAPTAEAGGPYQVKEGSTVQLDGTGSSDPHNAILSYSWSPVTHLTNADRATPTYSGIDDTVDNLTLTVNDFGGDVTEANDMSDDDSTTVTVLNVPPAVSAFGDTISEAGIATVHATFTDPGTEDTHTASINWGDGTVSAVLAGALAAGVTHQYGDNGAYSVTVTVTDDDGGVGNAVVDVNVGNLPPSVTFDASGAITFPGGDYIVVAAGSELPSTAQATDSGSDDLTFTWSVGDVNVHFNDGAAADPPLSPFGTFPFEATDAIDAVYAEPGVEALAVTVSDDDGGTDGDGGNVIVTGVADATEGAGWWKHQYSGTGSPHISSDLAMGYLEIVNAVSSVFSEHVGAATAADVHLILSPSAGDRRARARSELMVAWLQFASGAVAHDAIVPLGGNASMPFLDLMFQAEATILNPAATNSQLLAVEQLLAKVRHAQ